MKLTQYFKEFFNSNQSSGLLLIFCVLISLLIANSSLGDYFQEILNTEFGFKNNVLNLEYSAQIWINDGLMSVFFLLVGLEIKRELLEGELSDIKNASLPILAAIGGMFVPAIIYIGFTQNTNFSKGFGIPMATDIAFSLAIISLLGNKVPASIKLFLTALAIIDDLGAILVIALFYTESLHWDYLIYSALVIALLAVLNRLKITKIYFYLVPGMALWYFMHHSGIHATIAGVLLAFCIPTNETNLVYSPLEKLENYLHTPVSFFIMPIFALVNTNIRFESGMVEDLFSPLGYGIMFGLILGKILGICCFSWSAIKLKISNLPEKSNWGHLLGAAALAGIGFTMSIFIAMLCFKNDSHIQSEAKFAILISSFIAAILGLQILKYTASKDTTNYEDE